MLSKLKYIGLLFVFMLSTSIFGQNHNSRSLQDLQQDLIYYNNVLSANNMWFFQKAVINMYTLDTNYSTILLPRNEGIDKYINYMKMMGKYNRYTIDENIRQLNRDSDKIKSYIHDVTVPAIEHAIRNHPDNQNNSIIYTDEASGATECHSRGKGSFWVGTGRVKYYCSYHGSGQLYFEVPYVNKQKHGTSIAYYQNGNIQSKTDYWNGKRTKERLFRSTGEMYSCKNYDGNRYLGSCLKTVIKVADKKTLGLCKGHSLYCKSRLGNLWKVRKTGYRSYDPNKDGICDICGGRIIAPNDCRKSPWIPQQD